MNSRKWVVGALLAFLFGLIHSSAMAQAEMAVGGFSPSGDLSRVSTGHGGFLKAGLKKKLTAGSVQIPLSEQSVQKLIQKIMLISKGVTSAGSQIPEQSSVREFVHQLQVMNRLRISA